MSALKLWDAPYKSLQDDEDKFELFCRNLAAFESDSDTDNVFSVPLKPRKSSSLAFSGGLKFAVMTDKAEEPREEPREEEEAPAQPSVQAQIDTLQGILADCGRLAEDYSLSPAHTKTLGQLSQRLQLRLEDREEGELSEEYFLDRLVKLQQQASELQAAMDAEVSALGGNQQPEKEHTKKRRHKKNRDKDKAAKPTNGLPLPDLDLDEEDPADGLAAAVAAMAQPSSSPPPTPTPGGFHSSSPPDTPSCSPSPQPPPRNSLGLVSYGFDDGTGEVGMEEEYEYEELPVPVPVAVAPPAVPLTPPPVPAPAPLPQMPSPSGAGTWTESTPLPLPVAYSEPIPAPISEEEYEAEQLGYCANLHPSTGPLIFNAVILFSPEQQITPAWVQRFSPGSRFVLLGLGNGYFAVVLSTLLAMLTFLSQTTLPGHNPFVSLVHDNNQQLPNDLTFSLLVRHWTPVIVENHVFMRFATDQDGLAGAPITCFVPVLCCAEYPVVHSDYEATPVAAPGHQQMMFQPAIRYSTPGRM